VSKAVVLGKEQIKPYLLFVQTEDFLDCSGFCR